MLRPVELRNMGSFSPSAAPDSLPMPPTKNKALWTPASITQTTMNTTTWVPPILAADRPPCRNLHYCPLSCFLKHTTDPQVGAIHLPFCLRPSVPCEP